MAAEEHRLILIDRGEEHRHRWKTECSCGGFHSPNRRRKKEAVELHKQHVQMSTRPNRPLAKHGWREPTDVTDLPEALR